VSGEVGYWRIKKQPDFLSASVSWLGENILNCAFRVAETHDLTLVTTG
jgi:hypothetical protein